MEYKKADFLLIFDEICKKSSPFYLDGELFHFRHPRMSDFAKAERKREEVYNRLVSKGVLTRDGIIKKMKEQGNWDFELEENIKELKIDAEDCKTDFLNQVKKIFIEKARIKLKRKEKELKLAEDKLQNFIPNFNADDLSAREYHKEFVFSLSDDKMREKSEEEMMLAFNECISERINDQKIKELSVQNFYKPYYMFDSSQDLFGEPASKLSHFQINLMSYSSMFKNVFSQYSEAIPEGVAENPDEIMLAVERAREIESEESGSSRKGAKANSTESCDVRVRTKFGASKEDYVDMGIKDKFIDINKITEEKGGSIGAEQFMQQITKG